MKDKKKTNNAALSNRKAFHLYEILEKFETGIALQGTEVKSLRQGKASFKDAYARIRNGEVWLFNMHINPYDHGSAWNHDPLRMRKLLMHRYEIKRLLGKIEERGLTLVPLKIYFKNGRAKCELGLARGKKVFDKRKDITRRDAERQTQRELKDKFRLNI